MIFGSDKIKAGQLADLAVLSDDYFWVADDAIADITSVLTLLRGKWVHADAEFKREAPPLPPTSNVHTVDVMGHRTLIPP